MTFAKEHGNRQEYKRALEAYLPTSPVYDYLEGRVPRPSFTYIRLAELTEAEEKERINKEIGERRTRLGAKIGHVTMEVTREVFAKSDLEKLYESIIDWTNDDEIRRSYEEKLLQRAYDHLLALSGDAKADKRSQVMKLAHDMVIIKHPFKLAWRMELEWQDLDELTKLDQNVVREYIEFFPGSGMTKVLQGYRGTIEKPKDKDEDKENTDETAQDPSKEADNVKVLSAEERLLLLLDGLEECRDSTFAHRAVGDYYLQIEEYEGCSEMCRTARDLLRIEAQLSGLLFQNTFDAINSNLATCLVYYQSPKNHPEARDIFNDILKRRPESTAALLGIGLIFEEEADYEKATRFLDRALLRDPANMRIATEAAWCKVLNGDVSHGLEDLEKYLTEITANRKSPLDLKSQTLYRVGKCLWDLHTDRASRRSRNGPYARFIASLKANPNYAPPYTSLGLFYADYAKDKKRARQCFQKAFELSASEIEAAERLARDFANDKEWEIVEIIAQRVIDSGVARPSPGSKKKGISWPFAALGVVQTNNQQYPKSVISFQAALRISPADYNSWVGLGESYHSSGRYIAAQRALEHAESIGAGESNGVNSSETWFAQYMLANVFRELGDYELALARYKRVLDLRSNDFGVAIAFLQTLVEQSIHYIETGFYGRAAQGAKHALEVALQMTEEHRNAFNYWKSVGDACTIFSWIPGHAEQLPTEIIMSLLQNTGSEQKEYLSDLDDITIDSLSSTASNSEIPRTTASAYSLHFAVITYKRAIHVSANEYHAQAVAWYNLGLTEWRLSNCDSKQAGGSSQSESQRFAKAALRCFKTAIELEASNADFWNALGVATTQMNPKVAQHAFVRSLHLNERSARTWTNLGTLYLLQNDPELAHKAFGRAQSTDPGYAQAWVGEGLIAVLTGDSREGLSHFTHALEIADASSRFVKSQYVISAYENISSTTRKSEELTKPIQPIFALQQLDYQSSDATSYRLLLGLLQERIGDYVAAVDSLTIVCEATEVRYEETEDATSLIQFLKARTNLARTQLANNDFDASIESSETVLNLSEEQDIAGLAKNELQRLRLSAHLTAGLAHFKAGSMNEAIDMFQAALSESSSAPDVICLLSQVLWAKGGAEERGVAKEQLFDCIEKNEGLVDATMLLGAMSVLDGDKSTQEAIFADLQNMRVNDKLSASQYRRIDHLQAMLAEVSQDGSETSTEGINAVATSILLSPFESAGWSTLAGLASNTHAAQMALKTATKSVPPAGSLDAEHLSIAYGGTGSAGDAQRAIAICPWNNSSWASLQACTV